MTQVYQFRKPDGTELWFPIDAIKSAVAADTLPCHAAPFQCTTDLQVYADHLRIANDVQVDHAASLTPEQLEEPVLVVDLMDGVHSLVIDGSHRLWRGLTECIADPARARPSMVIVPLVGLQLLGLVFDKAPGPMADIPGYDPDAHHAAAMESYREVYSKAERFRS